MRRCIFRWSSGMIVVSLFSIAGTAGQHDKPSAVDHPELAEILARCADYCRKLENSVLDFICQEKIREEIFRPSIIQVEMGKLARDRGRSRDPDRLSSVSGSLETSSITTTSLSGRRARPAREGLWFAKTAGRPMKRMPSSRRQAARIKTSSSAPSFSLAKSGSRSTTTRSLERKMPSGKGPSSSR